MALILAAKDLYYNLLKGLACTGLVLKSGASQDLAASVTHISGAGAPVNGTTLVPGNAGVYWRTDPASVDTLQYVTTNGGTTWTAAILAS